MRRLPDSTSEDSVSPQIERRNFFKRFLALLTGGFVFGASSEAMALEPQGNDPFIGEIILFASNFAPVGWALCDGQLLSIASNTALFSLLGTTYGGDGRTTFGLPDLRGRVPMHAGSGPGLTPRSLGSKSGAETHILSQAEMPAHSHEARAVTAVGSTDNPKDALPATDPSGAPQYGLPADTAFNASAIGNTGGTSAHNNMQPYLTVNYVIALVGIFPSRP